jgi:excinuclease ABC subunit A
MSQSNNKEIIIKGARAHNLKNIDVNIKRNKLTVVTGVSGSGKSSLVFDTLYAEGQRRYVESLSAYARQFLGKMNKPDVDYIHGISPSIAIEQKVNTRNARSTVATSTEIYDYLKLLFARIGVTFSPISGNMVKRHTIDDVVQHILALPENTKAFLLVGINYIEKDIRKQLEIFLQTGFNRLFLNEKMIEIEEFLNDDELFKTTIKSKAKLFLLIDRFAVQQNDEDFLNRISDSIQTAFFEGLGECMLHTINENDEKVDVLFNNRFELDGQKFEEPSVNLFSFNNPFGACKTCEGLGNVIGIDEDLVVPDKGLSIFEDAIVPWKGEKMQEWKNMFIQITRKNDFPIHKPYYELPQAHKDFLWKGGKGWEGLNGFFKELEKQTYKIQYRVMLARYRGKTTCPDCRGTRLRSDANYVKLLNEIKTNKIFTFNGDSEFVCLSVLLLMSIDESVEYFNTLKLSETHQKIANRILVEITNRLNFLQNVGLGYLSLNRLSNTLSGGETQRINLATSLGSSLVGSLYILDEPSIGLHPRDTENLIKVLQKLRDIGNTVVVVEHDEEIMQTADEIIDIGPLAGIHGGEKVSQGNIDFIKNDTNSLTGKFLSGVKKIEVPAKRRKWKDYVEVKGARQHNLKGFDVKFPLHAFTVVTGVSGSGKTTLIKKILYPAIQKHLGIYSGEKTGAHEGIGGDIKTITQIEMVDQNPIGKSSRSNPITYIKAYDAIRDLYSQLPISKARGFKPQHFSFNVEGGRCETCQGEGEVTIEMQFMADIHLPCEECKGARFKEEVLDAKHNDKNISDLLNMSVDEALAFFHDETSIANKIKPLSEVGLGYIKLGQSSNTLSGGEAQRVKLASFLGKRASSEHVLFIFDEPTTGLHFNDINKLLTSFNALIDQGHTIIVIEHNMDVAKCADYIVDLGPQAGDEGGNLVFAGLPEDLANNRESYTAKYLKDKLK